MASEAEIRRLIRLENQLAANRKKLAAEDDKRMKSARDIKDNIANIEQQILDIRAKQTEETQEQVSVSNSLNKLLQSRINKSEVNVLLGKKFAEQTKELVENENELIKFANTIEQVCIGCVESGSMTKDLAILIGPSSKYLTTNQFLDEIYKNLKKKLN